MRYLLRLAIEMDTQRDGERSAEWVTEQIITYVRSWLATVDVKSELRHIGGNDASSP